MTVVPASRSAGGQENFGGGHTGGSYCTRQLDWGGVQVTLLFCFFTLDSGPRRSLGFELQRCLALLSTPLSLTCSLTRSLYVSLFLLATGSDALVAAAGAREPQSSARPYGNCLRLSQAQRARFPTLRPSRGAVDNDFFIDNLLAEST